MSPPPGKPEEDTALTKKQIQTPRRVVIQTDGSIVEIIELQVTMLELCEIGRRLIRVAGGEP